MKVQKQSPNEAGEKVLKNLIKKAKWNLRI